VKAHNVLAQHDERPGPPLLALAFAPVHKRALGVAVGTVVGTLLFSLTAFHVLLQPAKGLPLGLLAESFYGYEVSWRGAFVALGWGFLTGFVAGFFAAFVRNFLTAAKIFTMKTRAELVNTKDFLDHI
jgi:hypothetical protein